MTVDEIVRTAEVEAALEIRITRGAVATMADRRARDLAWGACWARVSGIAGLAGALVGRVPHEVENALREAREAAAAPE